MSFAWTLDGDWRTASVVLRQRDNEISGEIDGPDTDEFTAVVRRDVERILCLDIDATDFPGLGRDDPVVDALQKRFAGLRPVLFYTPYEAAAWCIIGQRIQMTQAATIKQRLADDYGDRGGFPHPPDWVSSPHPSADSPIGRSTSSTTWQQPRSTAHWAATGSEPRATTAPNSNCSSSPASGPSPPNSSSSAEWARPTPFPATRRGCKLPPGRPTNWPRTRTSTPSRTNGGPTAAGSRSCCGRPSDNQTAGSAWLERHRAKAARLRRG